MQNRYAGDIGDFAKYGLLRALGSGHSLGVAWYLFPDETHNIDGKHIAYLNKPEKWRNLDPELFDNLRSLVSSQQRNVEQIGRSKLLGNARFSSTPLVFEGGHNSRADKRANWFRNTLSDLGNCTIAFADPDNGLCEDSKFKMGSKLFGNEYLWQKRSCWRTVERPLFIITTLAAQEAMQERFNIG